VAPSVAAPPPETRWLIRQLFSVPFDAPLLVFAYRCTFSRAICSLPIMSTAAPVADLDHRGRLLGDWNDDVVLTRCCGGASRSAFGTTRPGMSARCRASCPAYLRSLWVLSGESELIFGFNEEFARNYIPKESLGAETSSRTWIGVCISLT
jgi:hypothetical protein